MNVADWIFLSNHSMTPARCAAKALMVLTTASHLHQSPHRTAPSGQSNKRGRPSKNNNDKKKTKKKQGETSYLLHCFQDTHCSPQTFPFSLTALIKHIICITVKGCNFNFPLSHASLLRTFNVLRWIFTILKVHVTQKDAAVCSTSRGDSVPLSLHCSPSWFPE